MAEHELISAKFLQSVESESATDATPAIDDAPQQRISSAAAWARASRWISMFAGSALVVCAMVVVVPYLTSASSGKRTSPIDWLIRLKGGKPDQTFEKWVRDSAESSQQEWQEMYRKSPAYQIDPSKPIDWHFEPPQGFGK
jgi:hypothetical protein